MTGCSWWRRSTCCPRRWPPTSRASSRGRAWLALTSPPLAELHGEHASLAAHCIARVELPPLRTRREELPALIRTMLQRLRPGVGLRMTPHTLEVLAGHSWPGNLRELHTVLGYVTERRSAGDVTAQDLPEAYQRSVKARRLTPLERLEYDAIVGALRSCEANKVHAAQQLGMSRSTLYRRMRALGIQM